jgi:hypothetical protein
MALVAVHLDPDTFQVLGVWLNPETSAYLNVPNKQSSQDTGREIVGSKGRGVTWDQWCRRLAERRSISAQWVATPRHDGEEARHVLARVVAEEAVNKRVAEQ